MAIARRIHDALERASWIRRMFEEANRLREERGADQVADLSLGNPSNDPPAAFFESLREEAEAGPARPHRYMTNPGYPEVRATVAAHLAERTGVAYEAGDIFMSVGAAGAINAALRVLLDPGDEVVLQSPGFVEYPFYVENFQGQVCAVPPRPDFLPDVDRIADACTANTRAVILNAPNNPTGRVYRERTWRDLGRALAGVSARLSRPIYLIFDDPYHHLWYTDAPPPEPARFYDQVLYVTSFSKDLGLAGERIGYLAVHPDALDRAEMRQALPFAMRALGHVNAPATMQRVAARLVDHDRSDVRAYYRPRRDRVLAALEDAGLEFPPLEGAVYAFPKAPIPDDLEFCRRMLDKGLVVVPGTAFDGPGHFRMSYAVDDAVLDRGLDILREGL